MNKEVWKPIKDYEQLYEVSNLGRVRSKTQVLKPLINNYGYLIVRLYKEGKAKTYLIHRLVATMFIANPQNLPEVNHIDENKQNNNVSNLEWCDRKYNCNYSKLAQKMQESRRKKVRCIELNKEFNSVTEASEFMQCHYTNICSAIRKGHKAKGYHWKYKEED